MGNELKGKGSWDEAIIAYDKAIGHHPNDEQARIGRGFAYLQKQDYDRAIAATPRPSGSSRTIALAHANLLLFRVLEECLT